MKDTTKQEAIKELKKIIKPGDIVYTILQHISSSGMSRDISSFIIGKDKRPITINWYIERILGLKRSNKGYTDGVRISGAGMDMGFEIVYSLSRALFDKKFYCIGEKCRSNDHVNGDRDYSKHLHSDGGYALKQEWI